jgi:hypothetical protein
LGKYPDANVGRLAEIDSGKNDNVYTRRSIFGNIGLIDSSGS